MRCACPDGCCSGVGAADMPWRVCVSKDPERLSAVRREGGVCARRGADCCAHCRLSVSVVAGIEYIDSSGELVCVRGASMCDGWDG